MFLQKHLNEHEKNTILEQLKRNTPEEQLSDLLHWTNSIKKHHEWKVHNFMVSAYNNAHVENVKEKYKN